MIALIHCLNFEFYRQCKRVLRFAGPKLTGTNSDDSVHGLWTQKKTTSASLPLLGSRMITDGVFSLCEG